MKKLVIIIKLALLFCGLSMTAFGFQQTLDADWVGSFRLKDKQERVDVHFKTEQGAIKGIIDFPLKEKINLVLSRINLSTQDISFEWQDHAGTIVFNGKLVDGTISGEVKQGQSDGTLELVRIAKVDSKIYADYAGLYEVSPNKLISIALFPPGPVYLDYETGRTGALFPLSKDILFSGPMFLIPSNIDATFRFVRGKRGEVTSLSYERKGLPHTTAKKITFRQEEVTFNNGNVKLSGTLTLPNTKGPHPATVRITGAGPGTRRNTSEFESAYNGIAFLSYDKRGTGKSTGDWREAGLEDLARDVLAGVQMLKSRRDIDPKQIGVGAGSEGGWVAPIVVSKDKDIAFMALYAGPAFNFLEEVLYEIEGNLLSDGFTTQEVTAVLNFERVILDMIKSGEALTDQGWQKIEAMTLKVQNDRWYPYVQPWPKGHWRWKKYFLMSQTETLPLLEKITIPVLAVYGGTDLNVPALRNIPVLIAAMKKAGNRDCTIVLFPRANHEFMEAVTGDLDEESPRLQRYVPGLFDLGTNWLRKRVRISK